MYAIELNNKLFHATNLHQAIRLIQFEIVGLINSKIRIYFDYNGDMVKIVDNNYSYNEVDKIQYDIIKCKLNLI